MTSQQTGGLTPTRRTLVKGAAWSVPVVAMGSATAHAVGASQCFQFTFGEGSSRCTSGGPGADYRLLFCVTNLCATGLTKEICIVVDEMHPITTQCNDVLTVRNSPASLCITLSPGETNDCLDGFVEADTRDGGCASNNLYFYFSVDGGEPQPGFARAPITCLDEAAPATTAVEEPMQEETTVVQPAPANVETKQAPIQTDDSAATSEGPTG